MTVGVIVYGVPMILEVAGMELTKEKLNPWIHTSMCLDTNV
jgi:hypothetical protein